MKIGQNEGIRACQHQILIPCKTRSFNSNSFLGCIRKSSLREVILSLYSVLLKHTWSAGSSTGLPSRKKDMGLLAQQRATKPVMGPEHLS